MLKIDLRIQGLSVYPPGATFGPYTLQADELVFVNEGSAILDSDGVRYPMPAGTVAFSAVGQRNHYAWDPHVTTRHGYVQFHTGPEVEMLSASAPKTRRLDPDDVVLGLLNHVLWLGVQRPAGWRDMASAAVGYALEAFLRGASGTRSSAGQPLPVVVERSLGLVARRWRSDEPMVSPTLGELALAAGVSVEHLCRVFSSTFGHGPAAVLRLLRLHRAATLLARSNMSVGDIAERCGFSDQFHFSRTFRRQYGAAPTAFRRDPSRAIEPPPELLPLLPFI